MWRYVRQAVAAHDVGRRLLRCLGVGDVLGVGVHWGVLSVLKVEPSKALLFILLCDEISADSVRMHGQLCRLLLGARRAPCFSFFFGFLGGTSTR